MERERVLSGGRPTGQLHLGHYLGALKPFVEIQDSYDCFWVVSDLHMLTTRFEARDIAAVETNTRNMVIDCVGAGFDPDRTTFYLQSSVPEMPQIFVLIQNLVQVMRARNTPGLAEMIKNESEDELTLGLLSYSVLQAADIISLRADIVPVGRDNIDYVDITREIVSRINELYSCSFKSPSWRTGKENRLIGTDGAAKMSKSLGNTISLRDTPEEVAARVTGMPWFFEKTSKHASNDALTEPVLNYLQVFHSDTSRAQALGESYRSGNLQESEAKEELVAVLENVLGPVRQRISDLASDPGRVDDLLKRGTERARSEASITLNMLKQCMGMMKI